MAKIKDQRPADLKKLANLMQQMLDDIDAHAKQAATQLNFVQLHFYEKQLLLGRPLMSEMVLRKMMQTHYVGLQHFCPDPNLKSIIVSTPWFGLIFTKPIFLKKDILSRQTNPWFIPWGVFVVSPEANEAKLYSSRQKAFLYCPDASEISSEIDWFEKEDAADSLTYQILTIAAYQQENAQLNKNLLSDPLPIYQQAKNEWQKIPSEGSDPDVVYEVAAQPQKLDEIDFAPKADQSVRLAYENVIKSIRSRRCRHRQTLRKLYKQKLEQAIFEGLPWSDQQRRSFLEQWQQNFFEQPQKSAKSKSNRWKQCEGVDRYTAARFIRHFVDKFIKDPSDQKAGEIACILWLLVWSAQEGKSDSITLQQVLNVLPKDVVLDDPVLKMGKVRLDISWGLHRFLLCLCGDGDRSRRLFKTIDQKGKALERALHDASKELLVKDSIPVLPAAFLISPHLYPGVRMTAAQRRAMKNARQLVPLRYTHKDVLTLLRKAQSIQS